MRIPLSTYRIQVTPEFNFQKAEKIIPYLDELGIDTVYFSPVFEARKGSTHGYDVINSNKINPELGSENDFNYLAQTVKKHKMGWLQDIVPNHMAYSFENGLIMDIFENGKNSPFRNFFDINWNHTYDHLKNKIIAPFLGRFYADCLHDGEIKLVYDNRGLSVDYYGNRFPLSLKSYTHLFSHNIEKLKETLGDDRQDDFVKFMGILHFLGSFNLHETEDSFYNQIHPAKTMLWEIYKNNPYIKEFMDENLKLFNGIPGYPESFDLLDDLLSRQVYRLTYWKVATEELNYRRFFTVNDLISLRVEDYEVFKYSHETIFNLKEKGILTGFRIDHIDGLFDPEQYLKRLNHHAPETYVVIEKILEYSENLKEDWPVCGTTGYDFLNFSNNLFCNRKNEKKLTNAYEKFLGYKIDYDELVTSRKRLISGKHMAGDIDNLALLIKKLSEKDRQGRDITLYGLKRALVEVMTFFPVYRTYINEEKVSNTDKKYIKFAIRKSISDMPAAYHELKFIEKFLLFDIGENLSLKEKQELVEFVMKLQQFTGPLIAKGFEDTFLYIYNRLCSLNEVGANPKIFGIWSEDFHKFISDRYKHFPHTMNTTSTHDTKRAEDVRARINVLSEIPDEWEKNVKKWKKLNSYFKHKSDNFDMPSPNDEYLIYQTLVGTFPFENQNITQEYVEKIKNYTVKAIREAKVYTAWIANDEQYEKSCIDFVEKILNPADNNTFLDEFVIFAQKINFFGMINSLSGVVLKILSPGVPDFYQGTELWDFSLVDPDNRKPVDYELRKKYLDEILYEYKDKKNLVSKLLKSYKNGKIKLYFTYQLLNYRKKNSDLFNSGEYIPLKVEGKFKNNIIAFARKKDKKYIICVIPRFLTEITEFNTLPLGKLWKDTKIVLPVKSDKWKNILTDEIIKGKNKLHISEIFTEIPFGVIAN